MKAKVIVPVDGGEQTTPPVLSVVPAESAAATVSPERTEAEKAFDEITNASALVDEVMARQTGTQVNPATPVADQEELSEEQRRQKRNDSVSHLMKLERAKRQKVTGRAALEKVVVGAPTVTRFTVLNDVSVGASLERFVALIDTALWVVGKRGPSVLGPDHTDKVINELLVKVQNMADEARTEKEQGAILLKTEKEQAVLEEFLEPVYNTAAISIDVHAKHPATLKVLAALKDFDSLILDLTQLHWNGKIEGDRLAAVRERQKRLMHGLFLLASRAIQGLRRKMDAVDSVKKAA